MGEKGGRSGRLEAGRTVLTVFSHTDDVTS